MPDEVPVMKAVLSAAGGGAEPPPQQEDDLQDAMRLVVFACRPPWRSGVVGDALLPSPLLPPRRLELQEN